MRKRSDSIVSACAVCSECVGTGGLFCAPAKTGDTVSKWKQTNTASDACLHKSLGELLMPGSNWSDIEIRNAE